MRKRRIQKDPCCCLICKEEVSGRGLHTHIDRTHLKLQKYSSGYNGRYGDNKYKESVSQGLLRHFSHVNGEIKEFRVKCSHCETVISIKEREQEFPKKKRYFCNRSCASAYSSSQHWTDEKKVEVQQNPEYGFRNKERLNNALKHKQPKQHKKKFKCNQCKTEIESYTKRVFCSLSCRSAFRKANTDKKRQYYIASQFNFNLANFPNEFDFSLIQQYGWYSPTNKRNNLKGVSRDHKVSVHYGFTHKIDPNIIKHPANCQLLLHADNKNKHTNCSITFQQLLEDIEKWNIKYKDTMGP